MKGEIDLYTAGEFAALMNPPSPGPASFKLVVDLRAVSFMDSSGVRELCLARTRCLGQGGWTRLVCRRRSVHVLLRAMRLDGEFPPYATIADARVGRARRIGPEPLAGGSGAPSALRPSGSR
ncbi:STAS domain-containing protein [Streptomyces sp. NPDC088747]|uniref:STAS domain-containing protein n=1 Tax=Streptomyces sp. NPDC088747 TaxID=3365886 RepID=UPI003829FEB5